MMERVLYEHHQIGYPTIVGLGIGLVAVFLAFALGPKTPETATALPVVFWVIVVCGALFSTMTVRVTDTAMQWWFGIKAIGRRVDLSDIASADVIRTSIFEGWGIHLTWHGWVWNVAGFNAVQIRLRSGTRYAIGTPEPQALVAALDRARNASS
ncbi:MAG: hypothetical protein JOY59_01260 [Candidatus Eremiobacteraeota bacterium]|nr:hypothetical protein [Candidatus Eremiobacteraeota bacterium]